ncbi:hypothetical protein [Kineococcus sp. SYSU DK001]|uniref:hypothetical protein n=1 Tax=Kineococcus sp. SYSU DK001 TaxID=3383122 RepID=UPI003D7C5FCD
MSVPADVAFDVVHDHPDRLRWDTLLREAHTVGCAPWPGTSRVRWCSGDLLDPRRTNSAPAPREVRTAIVPISAGSVV